ncbi:sensor histidine kinase YcbM [Paenibacillus sp. J23TS9]|uniref:sensor histidine kinase n=1 Tax=Paenibacillus sp. J23TS9 TaxID=2807193 RepID=UPI001B1527BC|nr:sensor histidine kinase [Paenibacillus sp. J23TS9]GIP29537.1 sensor histidine kinase YcbM [Paenibacillus sp. J23TS9]
MTAILLVLMGMLLLLNILQWVYRKKRAKQLSHMIDKLTSIMDSSQQEQLLLFTEDREYRRLLNTINRLLSQNRQSIAGFARTENAMRRMLANISHDLKTPLTVVLGYIETLNRQPDLSSPERERLLNKVHMKAVEIVELINRFFDLAKLESGDKEIPLTRIHINEMTRNSMLMFYDMIESEGLQAAIDIPDTPLYAWGNEEALSRALNNVLSNAVRYGALGKVIGMNVRGNEDRVLIEIWDKGKGIHEREQALIFERMYTLEDSRNKSFQGSGLGLTITKRLVELMGGEIRVTSKPHEQTVFTISLKRLS